MAHATESVWRYVPVKGAKVSGAQIDLLIDRSDRTINICEMKFSNDEFTINKKYAGELSNKVEVFREKTQTKKNIHLTMITTYGVAKNEYYEKRVQSQVAMTDLFVA